MTLRTERRDELLALLEARGADAAHLYRMAVEALERDLTLASLCVAAHCVRELIAVLPSALGYPSIARADASRAARELHRSWVENELPLDGLPSDAPIVPVPLAVYLAARSVSVAGAQGATKSKSLTAVIVTGQATTDADATVRRVHQAIEFFRKWSHVRDYTRVDRNPPPKDAVLQELEIIESALLNRLGNMADRARDIRSVLAAANRRAGAET